MEHGSASTAQRHVQRVWYVRTHANDNYPLKSTSHASLILIHRWYYWWGMQATTNNRRFHSRISKLGRRYFVARRDQWKPSCVGCCICFQENQNWRKMHRRDGCKCDQWHNSDFRFQLFYAILFTRECWTPHYFSPDSGFDMFWKNW